MSEERLLNCPFWTDRYILKPETGCWLWVGAKNSRGYGHLFKDGKHLLAHRVSYEYSHGHIPLGLTIDHQCRNRLCINPSHLVAMSQKENNLISNSPVGINKRKMVCKRGHPLVGMHIKIRIRKDGIRRDCLLCQKIYKRERRLKHEKE